MKHKVNQEEHRNIWGRGGTNVRVAIGGADVVSYVVEEAADVRWEFLVGEDVLASAVKMKSVVA
jgi:hypothetical protein